MSFAAAWPIRSGGCERSQCRAGEAGLAVDAAGAAIADWERKTNHDSDI
jgi:hypothetical protein